MNNKLDPDVVKLPNQYLPIGPPAHEIPTFSIGIVVVKEHKHLFDLNRVRNELLPEFMTKMTKGITMKELRSNLNVDGHLPAHVQILSKQELVAKEAFQFDGKWKPTEIKLQDYN